MINKSSDTYLSQAIFTPRIVEDLPPGISVTAPFTPAIERAKQILFRPFDLNKWIAIGFCAWLSALGQGGFNYNSTTPGGSSPASTDFSHVRAYLQENLAWILPLAAGLILIILGLWVLILWLRSRGTFMLLHCVALNRGEVTVPWRKFARESRSIWQFKLVLAAIGLAFFLPIIAWAIWVFFDMFSNGRHFDSGMIPILIVIVLVWICLSLPLFIASHFTSQFVAPIMYLRGGTCIEGWRVLLPLLEANPGRFILYLLFQIVIGIVIAFILIAFVVCTCCIGLLLLVIPFIGAVVRLPITVFLRSYSLLYLAQYGAEFDVFRVVEQTDGDSRLAT